MAAVDSNRQLSIMCDHVELAASATQSASVLFHEHGTAVTHAVVDACHDALRSTRFTPAPVQQGNRG